MFRTYHPVKAVPLLACLVGIAGPVGVAGFGCAPGSGAPDQNGTGGVPSAGGAAAVGAGGAPAAGGDTGVIASGGHPLLDIGDESSGGSPAGLGTNGGYVELTAAQVTDITGSQCDGKTAIVEPVPPVLEFVVDVSTSMNRDENDMEITPGSGILSKWDITKPALVGALDGLGDDVYVGMGAPGGGACVDDSTAYPIAALGPAGSAQRTTLATAIDTAVLVASTPTHDAIVFALENGLAEYTGPGNKFIVLITDGAPSQPLGCGPLDLAGSPTQPIIDEIAAANTAGVKSFIIGSPGSQAGGADGSEDLRFWLSDAAIAGGTPLPNCSSAGPNYCHLDMTTAPDFAAALGTALAEIGDAVVKTCSFTVPEDVTAFELENTTVIFKRSDQTAALVLPDADGDCAAGGWTRGPSNEVILCPATCDLVNADAGAEVSMSIGCNIVVK
jgi:hypothetical protein